MNRNRVQLLRLFELDRSIRAMEYPNCFQFARKWGVSRKTIERDIEYLRNQLMAPLEFDLARRGYRYGDKTWFLPALELAQGDLLYLMVAACALQQYRGTPVGMELDRVFSKIAAMLPEQLTIRPEFVSAAFTFTGPPAKPVNEAVWTVLVRGLLNRLCVDIRYRGFDSDRPTRRRIAPYHVANLQGEWYVLALCQVKNELRQFAIARVESAAITDEGFEPPAEFDVKKAVGAAFSRFASSKGIRTVRVAFDKEAAPWATDCQWHPSQKTVRRRDGSIEISLRVAGLLEVQRWVLGWGRHARVLAPPELKRMVRDEAIAMAESVRRMDS